jgi:hypothetical protein
MQAWSNLTFGTIVRQIARASSRLHAEYHWLPSFVCFISGSRSPSASWSKSSRRSRWRRPRCRCAASVGISKRGDAYLRTLRCTGPVHSAIRPFIRSSTTCSPFSTCSDQFMRQICSKVTGIRRDPRLEERSSISKPLNAPIEIAQMRAAMYFRQCLGLFWQVRKARRRRSPRRKARRELGGRTVFPLWELRTGSAGIDACPGVKRKLLRRRSCHPILLRRIRPGAARRE